jgi:hypothetical protein
MIALIQNMSAQRGKEMRDYAASRRKALRARRSNSQRAGTAPDVAIRRLDPTGSDRHELELLAGRDSSTAPSGDVIAAERDGQLLAAMSLTSGEMVADPFLPTAAARTALISRAGLLRRANDGARPIRLAHPSTTS